MYYPFESQVTPLTNVRRERMLPMPGEVLVHRGDRVEPAQIVARAELPGDFHILPVARLLGVSSAKVERYMRVEVGDVVKRGQVIAQRGRLFARPIKSPMAGTVTASGGGRVLIEGQSIPFELPAYIYGTVTNVLAPRGVIIETTGAVVQATWGAGGEATGVLKCLVKKPDEPLLAKAIDPACHGTILVGGVVLDEATLEQAQEFLVRGIVVGGLSPELVPQVEEFPLPIVVTEGIGAVPMSAPVFHLLTTNDGREASINGRIRTRWSTERPEVVIPLPAETLPPSETQPGTPLEVGLQVRVVRAPYMGAVGKVVAIPSHARRIETGAKVHGAEVDLGEGAPVFIPLFNLEVLR